ncbi:hypothetical protein EVAR_7993_1 [Eumeta japonica]|uniref:Uncharacterized protein n=1 Tax=Eumeta variegata TaxID=151549 RepID=A0A4C1TGY3_EUMVA|nr:hypothetical protein EVAR_7993_1 [Eumeta japonica]
MKDPYVEESGAPAAGPCVARANSSVIKHRKLTGDVEVRRESGFRRSPIPGNAISGPGRRHDAPCPRVNALSARDARRSPAMLNRQFPFQFPPSKLEA